MIQISGEAVGGLDQDGFDAVRGDVLEHGGETRPLVDQVGALDAVVAVLGDDLVSGGLGKLGDRCALTKQASLQSSPTWSSTRSGK